MIWLLVVGLVLVVVVVVVLRFIVTAPRRVEDTERERAKRERGQ